MNFEKKEFGIKCMGLALLLMVLGMGYLSAQTAGGPQSVATAANPTPSAQATPLRTPHHQHKKPMLGQKVAGEGIQPGYSANADPTVTTTQVAP